MNRKNQTAEQSSDREFVMTRVFAAPRTLVWQAWTDCEHLQHWWAPKGWTLPVCTMDFREGGVWHYCMQGPEGVEMESWGRAVYQEIVAPERIVYLDAFSDEAGSVNQEMPKLATTVTFEELDGKTRIVNRTLFASAADLEVVLAMGMEQGANEAWDQLEDHLTKMA